MRTILFGIFSLFFVLFLWHSDSRVANAQGTSNCIAVCHDGYMCVKFDPLSHDGDTCCKEPARRQKDNTEICRGKSTLVNDPNSTDPNKNLCCLAR